MVFREWFGGGQKEPKRPNPMDINFEAEHDAVGLDESLGNLQRNIGRLNTEVQNPNATAGDIATKTEIAANLEETRGNELLRKAGKK